MVLLLVWLIVASANDCETDGDPLRCACPLTCYSCAFGNECVGCPDGCYEGQGDHDDQCLKCQPCEVGRYRANCRVNSGYCAVCTCGSGEYVDETYCDGTRLENTQFRNPAAGCLECASFSSEASVVTGQCTACTGPSMQECSHANCAGGFSNYFNGKCYEHCVIPAISGGTWGAGCASGNTVESSSVCSLNNQESYFCSAFAWISSEETLSCSESAFSIVLSAFGAGTTSLSDCQGLCEKDMRCAEISWTPSLECILYASCPEPAPSATWERHIIHRDSDTCLVLASTDQREGWTLLKLVEAATDADCSVACSSEPDCAAWVNEPSSMDCWLGVAVPTVTFSRADRTFGIRCVETRHAINSVWSSRPDGYYGDCVDGNVQTSCSFEGCCYSTVAGYISGYTAFGTDRLTDFGLACDTCKNTGDCVGITENDEGTFTLRSGAHVNVTHTGETSYILNTCEAPEDDLFVEIDLGSAVDVSRVVIHTSLDCNGLIACGASCGDNCTCPYADAGVSCGTVVLVGSVSCQGGTAACEVNPVCGVISGDDSKITISCGENLLGRYVQLKTPSRSPALLLYEIDVFGPAAMRVRCHDGDLSHTLSCWDCHDFSGEPTVVDGSCTQCSGARGEDCAMATCMEGFHTYSRGKCSACNDFSLVTSVLDDSCTSCTGPHPSDCVAATCAEGYDNYIGGSCLGCALFETNPTVEAFSCTACINQLESSCLEATCAEGHSLYAAGRCLKDCDIPNIGGGSWSCTGSVQTNAKCVFEADTSHVCAYVGERTCFDGEFDELPVCSGKCFLPAIDGGLWNNCGEVANPGQVCTFAPASSQYTCEGVGNRTCSGGVFDVTPMCSRQCEVPSITGLSSPCTANVPSGSWCSFSASPGFACTNTGARLCTHGEWDAILSCEQTCKIPSIEGGTWLDCVVNREVSPLTTCEFAPLPGYYCTPAARTHTCTGGGLGAAADMICQRCDARCSLCSDNSPVCNCSALAWHSAGRCRWRPATLVFTRMPTFVESGAPIAPSPEVMVLNEFGGAVDYDATVTLEYTGGVPANALIGEPDVVTVDGTASFDVSVAVHRSGTGLFHAFTVHPVTGEEVSVDSDLFFEQVKDCDPGTHQAIVGGSAVCLPCEPGKRAEFRGSTACVQCDSSTYASEGTKCLPCRKGGTCDGGLDRALPGYWRSADMDYYVACQGRDKRVCLGGETSNGGSPCGEGHGGPFCSQCAPTYALFGKRCAKCLSPAANVVLVLLAAVAIMSFIVYTVRGLKNQKLHSALLRILLTHLQILSLTASFVVHEMSLFGRSFEWTQATTGSPTNFFPVRCLVQLDHYGMVAALFCLQVFATIVAVGVSAALSFRHKKPLADYLIPGLGVWLFTSYPAVSAAVLQGFSCRSDIHRLKADLTLSCPSSQYTLYLVLGSLAVLGWVVAIPMMFFGVLLRTSREEKQPSARWSFLTLGYKQETSWFECFVLFRKQAFVALSALLTASDAQLSLATLVLIAAIILQMRLSPLVLPKLNTIELCSLVVASITVVASAMTAEGEDSGVAVTLQALMIISNLVFVISLVCMEIAAVAPSSVAHVFPRWLILDDASESDDVGSTCSSGDVELDATVHLPGELEPRAEAAHHIQEAERLGGAPVTGDV